MDQSPKKVTTSNEVSANYESYDTKIGSSLDLNANLRKIYKAIVVGERKVGKTSIIDAFHKVDERLSTIHEESSLNASKFCTP